MADASTDGSLLGTPAAAAPPAALAGEGYVAAVDLGGTKILAALFDPQGRIVARAKKPTGADHSPAAVIDRMVDCIYAASGDAAVAAAQVLACGVGAPGPIDPQTGTVEVAPNLGWEQVPLRAELERRLGIPVAVGNDVRVAVLAESVAGAGRGVRHMVGIWPGTGVGGGLILDGQLYHGAHDLAGEIGHITVKLGGPRCGCGGRGHLEALASRTAIVREIAKAVKKGEKTVLTRIVGREKDLLKATSGDLAEAWEQGDKVVSKVLDKAAKALAAGIASVANLLNPELVVLGGGVIEGLGEPYVEEIRRRVRKHPLYGATRDLRIVKAALGDDAGITGAALLARRAVVAAQPPITAG